MAASPGVAVEASELTFAYGTSAWERMRGRQPPPALDGVNLRVREGEVFGVLGPNGAGKTTLMKLVSSVYVPTSGQLRVLGHRLPGDEAALRPRIGVAFSEFERAFNFRLSAEENLRFFTSFYGYSRAESRRRIHDALATTGLLDRRDTLFQHYSTGMKHRLALARALIPEPELLILDEPTAGVDARTSRELGTVVRGLAAEGVTILYTTHRLEEAAALCDRVLVLNEGRAAAMASPGELTRLAEHVRVVHLHLDGVVPGDAERALAEMPGVRTITTPSRSHLRVQTTEVHATTRALLDWLSQRELAAERITSEGASLTDAFMAITEGRIEAPPVDDDAGAVPPEAPEEDEHADPPHEPVLAERTDRRVRTPTGALASAAVLVAAALFALPALLGPAAYASYWTVPAATLVLAVALVYTVSGGHRVVGIGNAFVRRILLVFWSYKFQIVSVGVYILLTVALFWTVGGTYVRVVIGPIAELVRVGLPPDIVVILILGLSAWPIFWKSWEVTAMGVRREQWEGTFESMVSLPRGAGALPFAYLYSRTGYTIAFQIAVLAVLTAALPPESHYLEYPSVLLNMAAVLVLTILCMWGMGLLFGGLAILYKQVGPADAIVKTLFLFLAGIFVPLTILPGWMQTVAQFLPLTYSFQLLRLVMTDATPLAGRLDLFLPLAAFTLVFVVAGNVLYRRYVDRARREGAIQGY